MKGKEIILSVGKEGKGEKIRKEIRIKSYRFYVSIQKLYIFVSVDTQIPVTVSITFYTA